MSDLPFFNFYPKDFASDGKVEAMTTEEIGAYILLLAKAWHEQPPCSVPDDNSILARWTRLGDDGWLRARPRVVVCFYLRDGRLFQPRLELEYRKARAIVNKKSEGGKKGVEAREAKRRTLQGIHDGHHQGIHPQSESDSEKTKTERGNAGAIVRIPVAAVSATTPPDESDPVWAALDAWAFRSRGKPTSAAHNEHAPLRMAMASWEQEAEFPGGVDWQTAVLRCIKAAQASGTKFGDSPRYAIRVVNGLLSAWRQGTPPEPPASSLNSPRFVPDDDGAEQDARLRAQREAKAKQNGVKR